MIEIRTKLCTWAEQAMDKPCNNNISYFPTSSKKHGLIATVLHRRKFSSSFCKKQGNPTSIGSQLGPSAVSSSSPDMLPFLVFWSSAKFTVTYRVSLNQQPLQKYQMRWKKKRAQQMNMGTTSERTPRAVCTSTRHICIFKFLITTVLFSGLRHHRNFRVCRYSEVRTNYNLTIQNKQTRNKPTCPLHFLRSKSSHFQISALTYWFLPKHKG